MRNRTIRSVLARRPMFANGGMLPPVTQSPMAAGILSSSAPLIETVNTQQSPNGNVGMSMANGGVARFRHGGFHKYPSRPMSPYLGSTSPPPLPTISATEAIAKEIRKVAKALESIIPGLDTTRLSGEEIKELAIQYGVIGDAPEGSEVDASQTGTFMPLLRRPPARKVDTSTPFVPVEGPPPPGTFMPLLRRPPARKVDTSTPFVPVEGPPPPKKFAGIGSIFDLGGPRTTAIRPRVAERVSEIVEETKAPTETFMPPLRKPPPRTPDISQLLGTPEGSEIDASQVPDAVSALDEYYRTGINPADMTMDEVKKFQASLPDAPEGMVGSKDLLGRQIRIDEQKIADAQAQDAETVTGTVQASEYDPPRIGEEPGGEEPGPVWLTPDSLLVDLSSNKIAQELSGTSAELGEEVTETESVATPELSPEEKDMFEVTPQNIPFEKAAPGGEGAGKITVQNTLKTDERPVITDRPKLFSALTRRGPDTDPDIKSTAVEDVVKRGVELSQGNRKVDVSALKRDIEALLPAVEEDPMTEGLLIAMLGASIAGGKDPNAWANIGAGVEKGLPGLINYRSKQTAAKRARSMGVAKMAITQKLSLESEQRAEARAIRAEGRKEAGAIRKEQRAQTQKLLEIGDYTTLKPHTVPANLFEEGAKGNITIPAFTALPLDSHGRKRMAEWGISVVPVGKYTPKPADQIAAGTVIPMSQLSPKELNLLYQNPTPTAEAPWEEFGSNFRPTYMTPKPAGVLKYGAKRRMSGNDWLALHKEYETVRRNYGKLYDSLAELSKIDPKKLVGTRSVQERLGDSIRGLAGYSKDEKSFMNQWADGLLGRKDLSAIGEFETRGRILLARMAPIILGESGKTISDADRIRVARSLGFEVDVRLDPNGKEFFGGIIGVNSSIFQNPNSIRAAIKQTASIVSDSMEKMHSIYQRETQGVGVPIPDLEKIKIMGKQKAKPRLTFDLTKPIT